MPILSSSDINQLSAAWAARRDEAFSGQVQFDFINFMKAKIPVDLKERLLVAIESAWKPKEMNCGIGGVEFPHDHVFYADGWGSRKMTIGQLIYHTEVLNVLSAHIGPNVRVTPRIGNNHAISFTIDFFPREQRVIQNPEDEDDILYDEGDQ